MTKMIAVSAARNIVEVCSGIASRIAKLKQLVKVENGGTIWLGSESVNVLTMLIQVVANIAITASSHTHPSVGACSQATTFAALSTTATELKTELDPIVE